MEVSDTRLSTAISRVLPKIEKDLDRAEKEIATRAIQESIAVVSELEFGSPPWVGVTDDGVLLMQWERDSDGIALSFSATVYLDRQLGWDRMGRTQRTTKNTEYLKDYRLP